MLDSRAVDRTLAEVRSGLTAPAQARERVRARLEAGGAFAEPFGAASPGGSSASLARSSSVARSLGVARSTVAVLVGIGFGAGYWLGVHQGASGPGPAASGSVVATSSSPQSPAPEPAPEPTLPAPLPPSSAPPREAAAELEHTNDTAPRAAEPTRPPRARSHAAPGTAKPGTAKNGFGDEVALLQRAERALRAGEAELALSFVHELERRYPGSPLREERAAARVMAECALNRAGARERGVMFLRDRPASVYSDRVHQLCTLGDTSELREGEH
jgi:hypothetical protein